MLETHTDGTVAVIRLDHGPVNTLDFELLEVFTRTVAELEADPAVGAIVLTGNGRAFSAGVDLQRILDGGGDYTRPFLDALSAAFLAPLRCTLPIVAAVDGHAIAGGAVLAAACDRVIAADDERIRIGLAELAVGVPFPTAAIEIMRRRLGPRLDAVVLTATNYMVTEAQQLGFVDDLVGRTELLEAARTIAAELAQVPRLTMSLTKEHLRGPVEFALAQYGGDRDARMSDAWASDQIRSALESFVSRTLRRERGG